MVNSNLYTLVLRSNTLGQSINSGSIRSLTYRILFQQFLPDKYRKYSVKCHFKSIPSTTVTAKNLVITASFGASQSYDTVNQGRSFVLGVPEHVTAYNGTNYYNYFLLKYADCPPIVVDNPNESSVTVTLTNSDGSTLLQTDFNSDYILTLTFQGISEN